MAISRPATSAASAHWSTICNNVDHFLVTADFDSYAAAQRKVEQTYAAPAAWWPKAVLNTAHMGWFSSDRTVRDYARDIWRVPLGT